MMVPAERWKALRRGKRAVAVAASVGCAALAFAPGARAGQIVWSADDGIWAMNDNGSDPHELVSAHALAGTLPGGSLLSPDVFQAGGSEVLFLGQTQAFAGVGEPQACGADCSATFGLSAGLLTELGPSPGTATGSAYYETQPRVTADGQELFTSSLVTGITAASSGSTATALVERPLTANGTVTAWGPTAQEAEPAAGFDGTPDPADATEAAWVEAQGCGFHVTDAQGVSHASCQYAVQLGTISSGLTAPVITFDNEYVSAGGRGPTSLAISSDGSTLLLVDPSAPADGIYTTPVAGAPGTKPVTEVLAQPPGWTFGQARFAGQQIVFDAHQLIDGKETGDIYTVPASCTSCSFPKDATNLTHDPAADSSDPAWTSATRPLSAVHRALAAARITSVSVRSRRRRKGQRLRLAVTLSAAGRIVVRVAGRPAGAPAVEAVGSVSFAGHAGRNELSVGRVAGRALAPGSYTAAVALGDSGVPAAIVRFSVR
jgi:hypothetical protein